MITKQTRNLLVKIAAVRSYRNTGGFDQNFHNPAAPGTGLDRLPANGTSTYYNPRRELVLAQAKAYSDQKAAAEREQQRKAALDKLNYGMTQLSQSTPQAYDKKRYDDMMSRIRSRELGNVNMTDDENDFMRGLPKQQRQEMRRALTAYGKGMVGTETGIDHDLSLQGNSQRRAKILMGVRPQVAADELGGNTANAAEARYWYQASGPEQERADLWRRISRKDPGDAWLNKLLARPIAEADEAAARNRRIALYDNPWYQQQREARLQRSIANRNKRVADSFMSNVVTPSYNKLRNMVSNLLTKPLQNGSSKPNAILPAQSTPTTSATSYVGVPSTPGITNSPNNPQKATQNTSESASSSQQPELTATNTVAVGPKGRRVSRTIR